VSIRHSVDPEDDFDGDSDNGTRRLRKTWQLSLKEVTPADAAPYMCQSSGGISQIAYLHVLGIVLYITKLNYWSICNFPFLFNWHFFFFLSTKSVAGYFGQ